MSRRKKKIVISLTINPLKVRRGHTAYRGGAGIHGDRRLKRLKTRQNINNVAIKEE